MRSREIMRSEAERARWLGDMASAVDDLRKRSRDGDKAHFRRCAADEPIAKLSWGS